MDDCHPFFRYFIFFIIFLIGFFTMYMKKIELIGIGIVFAINIINSYFLGIDIINSDVTLNGFSSFLIVSIPSLVLLVVSSILVMITLSKAHAQYTKKGSKIKMSPENRKKLDQFKLFFMLCIIFMGILSTIFFLQPQDSDFFKIVYGDKKYFLLCLLLAIIKYGLSGAVLGLSGYLVYLSNELAQLPNQIIG